MPAQPFLIKPVSSASDAQIVNNIKENMDRIPKWFKRCKKTSNHGIVFSAGPSTELFLKNHLDLLKKHKPIFCIKHALPILKKYGVTPDYCVVLDPRPIDNISTLGFKRKDLYNEADKRTKFFVASMTHTSVTKHLIDSGYDVIGWHALTPEMGLLPNDYKERLGDMLITGGTSSGTRTIELAFFAGITTLTCVGFDSSFSEPKPTNIKDAKGKQKFLKITVKDKPFWTTGELIAQAQDFERLVKNGKNPSDIRIFDVGLESSLVNELVNHHTNSSWSDLQWNKEY